MNISVFGIGGYVGIVTSVCLAKMGHKIEGVDIVGYKVSNINNGMSPIKEKGVDSMLNKYSERITASDFSEMAVHDTDISFICVGTPPKMNGDMDFSIMEKTCKDIGQALKNKEEKHIIVIRSTIFPGTFEQIKFILENSSGKRCGKDFYLLTNPEFLREGSAIEDFFNPPAIIIGAEKKDAKIAKKVMNLFKSIKTNKWIVSPNIAQMIKYANNSWHALKVCYANEIGAICNKMDIDSRILMDIFCQDNQLNLSSYYMRPGFAFGGSCLPKETSTLRNNAQKMDVDCPLINSIPQSNIKHINRAIDLIKSLGKKKIGFLGISFKPRSDDLRGNPALLVINRLLSNNNFEVSIYDPIIKETDVERMKLSYRKDIYDLISMENLKEKIYDISGLFTTKENLLKQEIIIISNRDPQYKPLLKKLSKNQIVVDLQNIYSPKDTPAEYRKIV